jgi:hypothetical protein
MGFFTKKDRGVSNGTTLDNASPLDDSKTAHATDDAVPNDSEGETSSQEDAVPTQDAQAGVKQVEGITLTWSKKSLIAVFGKYVTLPSIVVLLPAKTMTTVYGCSTSSTPCNRQSSTACFLSL